MIKSSLDDLLTTLKQKFNRLSSKPMDVSDKIEEESDHPSDHSAFLNKSSSSHNNEILKQSPRVLMKAKHPE